MIGWRPGLKLIVVTSIAGAAYMRIFRPFYKNWGATPGEVARHMPLDERVPNPLLATTRAITVNATAEKVWPWIVQMGEPPRAGFYSYTWIERMQGLRVENTDRILPEFQTVKAGESLDARGDMKVLDVSPGRYIALGPAEVYDWLHSTWVIALYQEGESKTRVVARLRAWISVTKMVKSLPPWIWPFWLLIDPGVFIMERKMLLGIKERAEAVARHEEVVDRP